MIEIDIGNPQCSNNYACGMKNNQLKFLLILAVFFAGCQPEADKSSKKVLKGLWTLQIMESYDPDTDTYKEWRDGMQGYILYDGSGHMALNLAAEDYQNFDFKFPNFTDTIAIEALRHLTKNYFYVANYTVFEDQGIVEHARLSHSNPGEWHGVVRRRYAFSGDTLIITPVEEKNKGLRLKWLKATETK